MANNQILGDLQQAVGYLQAKMREQGRELQGVSNALSMSRQREERLRQDLEQLSQMLANTQARGVGDQAGQRVMNIESIPGRRIPFDLICDIPIAANTSTMRQQTRTISQDGPYVAVARFATFQSSYQFAAPDPETAVTATFFGRSFGRFRPISSSWDLNDASAGVYQPVVGAAFPGTGAPIVASAANLAGFRSMEFDGLIRFLNQGVAYPRSNQQVPSSFWTTAINSPFQLGALDFFERGEVLQWEVTPTHVNNAPFGNLARYAAGGLFPFLDSQFDVHEGVNDPLDQEATEDPVSRTPDGILHIGFHGYKIIQPPGPVQIT